MYFHFNTIHLPESPVPMIKKCAISILLLIAVSFAAEPAGTIQSIIGTAEQNPARVPGWKPARVGAKIFLNDQLRTSVESSAELRWANGGVLRIAEQSTLAVTEQPPSENSKDPGAKVIQGRVWANMQKISNTGKKFSIESPTAVAGIRGTVFRVDVGADSATDVLVYEGKVAVGPGAALKQDTTGTDTTTRKEIEGPKEMEGPREVTLSDWVTIVAGQQIRVEKTGAFKTWQFDKARDSTDDWVQFNQARDRAMEKK
jgi:hypothetical protein